MGDKKNEDSEDIYVDTPPDDVTSLFESLGYKKIKISLFLFIIFIFMSSDVFIERVLAGKDDIYASGRHATPRGICVQGILMSIGYILISMLIDCNCI